MAVSTTTKRGLEVARNDVAVKLDAEVAKLARIVAAYKGVPMAQYISDILRPIIQRDLEEEAGKVQKSAQPRSKAKPEK
jgi:hypothetical protein